ncbi:hypothetical protein [Streptomyces sp. NPDC059611]|uniref:hypothetical protein n=1 Tax=Streptomyces sp. NPDC059611 TaxID=3346884 RepID=UPI0036BA5345
MPVVGGMSPNPWSRWALRWGVWSAVVALGSVWVVEPAGRVGAIIAAGVAVTALLVFVATMPRRQPPSRRRARRGTGE